MYLNGDRQQNSYVLADKIANNLMSGEINKKMVAHILRRLMVYYFSYMGNNRLNKQIELFEQHEAGSVDMPIDVNFHD